MLWEGCHTVARRSSETTPELTQVVTTRPSLLMFKLTAIMQVGHLGSCLTRKLTGRYAFDVICRPRVRDGHTIPEA